MKRPFYLKSIRNYWINWLSILILTLLNIGCDSTAINCSSTAKSTTPLDSEEIWPNLPTECDGYQPLVQKHLDIYKNENVNYFGKIQSYQPFNDFLNFGLLKRYDPINTEFDADGLPTKQIDGTFYYSPVTIAQFALVQYGRFIRHNDEVALALLLKSTQKLMSLQNERGALLYLYPWTYFLENKLFEPGWTSGMAQGQALSVYARIYHITNDSKYLKAGEAALDFMLTPVDEGGTLDTLEDLHPSLKNYLIIEEYLAEPASYTLNGFMFSLIGLYDWWQLNPEQTEGSHARAKKYFEHGIKTLERILPYYDLGGITSYDMRHITYKSPPHIDTFYHAVHVYLLHALASVTGNSILSQTEKVWANYVADISPVPSPKTCDFDMPINDSQIALRNFPFPNPNCYRNVVNSGLNEYYEKQITYSHRLQTYTPFNDYLVYSTTKDFTSDSFKMDEKGLPLKKYPNGFFYTPVIIAEFALTHYGKYLKSASEIDRTLFYAAADKLIEMQDERGALGYPFAWKYYLTGETYQEGWVSGMAQGQALSVYARAYHLSKDPKYVIAGEKALTFMLTPVENGGTLDTLEELHPSLKEYIIIEEYLAEPASYTLNGYMYSLLGLYDWWQLSPNDIEGSHAKAMGYFAKGIETLVKILPYYDIGGFSVYDLGYITHKADPHISASYHAVHIYLLHALFSVTNNSYLEQTEKLWASYVDK